MKQVKDFPVAWDRKPTEKFVRGLKIHQKTAFGSTSILRVPGGAIYKTGVSSVFVPLPEEIEIETPTV